jgi:hypothetical protein
MNGQSLMQAQPAAQGQADPQAEMMQRVQAAAQMLGLPPEALMQALSSLQQPAQAQPVPTGGLMGNMS